MSDSKAPSFDWVLFHTQKSRAIRRYDGFEYDADKKITYTNFKLFSFENDGDNSEHTPAEPQPAVDDGEIEDDRQLPF